MTYKFPRTPVVFSSRSIDMLATGTTPLFTAESDFVVTQIIFYGLDITDLSVPAIFNLGTNSTDFDNFIAGVGSSVVTTGQLQGLNFITTPGPYQVAAGGVFTLNVISGATATTCSQRIDVVGFYVN